ncbi:MAG: hypothetical protein U1F43_06205 [Myxococcota bacterium]
MRDFMNLPTSLTLLLLATASAAGPGCGSEQAKDPDARLQVSVAPLRLEGIREATYRITVRNSDPAPNNIVWQEESLSSTQYGDGKGALTYVGTCDASKNPHRVELELLSLSDASHVLTSPGDFANPAPAGSPLALSVVCKANADSPVTFDLTLVRAANQGFFDIAVNFSDIFCSAKLDCSSALLFDGDTRAPTAIVGFACTAGQGDSTFMYLSDLTLTCQNADGSGKSVTTLPLHGIADGQQGPKGEAVYQWAQYSTEEFVDQTAFDKCGWNFAVGLDTAALAGKKCTLSAVGTAADHALAGPAVPHDGAYPIITWSADVLTTTGALCSNNALNAIGSGVQTSYVTPATDLASLPKLTSEHVCGEQKAVACGTNTPVGGVTVRPDGQSFTVDVSNATSPSSTTFTLPAGWVTGDACCQADCCGTP